MRQTRTTTLLLLALSASLCTSALAQDERVDAPLEAPVDATTPDDDPTPLTWAGPRLLQVDDPQPLYAVTPVPVDVTAAALVCDDERLELGPPVWIHPARTGHAWAVPPNAAITAPRCILEVQAEDQRFVSDHHIRIRKDAPVSEIRLPASAIVEGSGGGGLGVTIHHLTGPVRVRLLSLTRTSDVAWDLSLPDAYPDGDLRLQIPLPEEVLEAGEYLLAFEGPGGTGAVCDQPVFVAGEALVDIEEIHLEPLSESYVWLVISGDGAEDIGSLSLDTPAGRLPLPLEALEGTNLPTVRTRVRRGLLKQFGTITLRMEESGGSVLIDVSAAVAASDDAKIF